MTKTDMSYKSIFLSIVSAILLIFSFPKPDLGFLAWFALIPWFSALKGQSPRQAFFTSYLVGLVFFSGTIWWVNHVTSLGFAVLVLYLALYSAVFGLVFSFMIVSRAQSVLRKSALLFFLPCVWVGLEYIRSHLGSGFGWALLGYSQYKFLPVIQISDITGAYGVSFLIVLVNVGVWQAVNALTTNYELRTTNSRARVFYPIFYILVAVILALGYGYFRLSQNPAGQEVKIATIQGNIPQNRKWDARFRSYILEKYSRLSEQASYNRPDLIVWPETAVPGYLENDPYLLQKIAALSKKVAPAALLLGTPHQGEGGAMYNSATLVFDGEAIQRYDKLHLVPFGEFIPWADFFSRFSFAQLIGNFKPGSEYTVFSLPQGEARFSALICFEDVFAGLARNFVLNGAEILVNMTNDAWFGDSGEPHQHLQASVFRAVENRVNVVRSANTGVSCFIDPRGKILSRISDYSGREVLVQGEKTQVLTVISMPGFYSRFGDIFAWLCLVGAFLGLLRRRFAPPHNDSLKGMSR